MDKIPSFKVDHTQLDPGIYLSRTNYLGEYSIHTYDVRMLKPNAEPVMDTSVIHTLEHLGATYLRTVCGDEMDNESIYFGPMGCRTGFYYVTPRFMDNGERVVFFREMFKWIANYEGKVPGSSPQECGNYLDLNLNMAKYYAKMFLERMEHFTPYNFIYQYIKEE